MGKFWIENFRNSQISPRRRVRRPHLAYSRGVVHGPQRLGGVVGRGEAVGLRSQGAGGADREEIFESVLGAGELCAYFGFLF